MKIKIISLEDEKAIRFDNISSKLEVLDNNNFKNKVKYYKVEKNVVEVYYLTEKEDNNSGTKRRHMENKSQNKY